MNKAPIFQHRHYKAIAAVLDGVPLSSRLTMAAWLGMRDALADAFARDNPRFDRARFLAAANGKPINGRDKVRS